MSRPEVLVYIDWFSPGFKAGGPIRSMLNLAKQLQPFVRFNIVTRDRDYLSDTPYSGIQSDVWQEFQKNHRIIYLSPGNCTFSGIRAASNQIDYTKVYVNGFLSPRFSILPLLIHKGQKDIITLAPRGMLRSSATTLKPIKKSIFFFISKLVGLHRGIRFHATDEQELRDISNRYPGAEVLLSPNLPRPLPTPLASTKSEDMLKVVFIGRVAPEKNLSFVLKLLKNIEIGQIELRSFGAIYDQDYWRLCQKYSLQLPENVRHEHRDFLLPDEVISTIKDHDLLFLPSYGENFGHVILESLMTSRPVLISDQTPWTDLKAARAGADIPLEEIGGFEEFIRNLVPMNREEHQSLCEGAYQVAKSFCEDRRVLAQAKALFLD